MATLSFTTASLIILFLTCVSPVEAQGKKSVDLRFRTSSVSAPINDLRCVTKKGSMPVFVPGKKRSKVLEYRGARTMVFFRQSDQIEGEPLVPIAKVTLKEGIQYPLLIFIKSRRSKNGRDFYRIQVVDDDPKKFRDGSMKFINLTQRTLYVIVGQKDEFKKVIKPGGLISHQLANEFKGNLPIKIALKTKKGYVPVMHSRVFPNQNVRDLYFIWPLPKKEDGHRVRISTLRERGDVAQMRLKRSRPHLNQAKKEN